MPTEDEYSPEEEGPEARLHRREADAYARRHVLDMDIIDGMLNSLRPSDSKLKLFTWAQIKKWKLRRRRIKQ